MWPALLLIVSALSGCVGSNEEKSVANPSSSDAIGSGSTKAQNLAPVAVVKVVSDGKEVPVADGSAQVLDGHAVTLDASGSSDPDHDALTFEWTVDASPAGETGPALTQTFALGTHVLMVRVGDGRLVSSAVVNIVVQAPPVPPITEKALSYTFSGVIMQLGEDNITKTFNAPAGVKKITASLTWDDGVLSNDALLSDIDLYLFDAKGTVQGQAAGIDFEYISIADPAKLSAGLWKANVVAFQVPTDSNWTLNLIVWMVPPTAQTFTGTDTGARAIGAPGDSPYHSHKVTIPAGTDTVIARLTWTTTASTASCGRTNRILTDYDLQVWVGGKDLKGTQDSGNGLACEFGFTPSDPGKSLAAGEWDFRVIPFLAPSSTYTLLVEYA